MPEDAQTPTEPTLDAQVGRRVRLAMWDAKMSQTELADAIGLDQPRLSRRLRGETPFLAREVAAAADALDVPVGLFLEKLDEPGD